MQASCNGVSLLWKVPADSPTMLEPTAKTMTGLPARSFARKGSQASGVCVAIALRASSNLSALLNGAGWSGGTRSCAALHGQRLGSAGSEAQLSRKPATQSKLKSRRTGSVSTLGMRNGAQNEFAAAAELGKAIDQRVGATTLRSALCFA